MERIRFYKSSFLFLAVLATLLLTLAHPVKSFAATFSITVNTYNDPNTNGVKDSGETAYANANISLSSGQTAVTNASGVATFSNLPAGNYAIEFTNIPSGYKATTSNPVISTIGTTSPTVNFGIAPIQSIAVSQQITVNGTAVTSGQTISGNVKWIANVTQGSATSVNFAVDGTTKFTELIAPFQYNGDPDGVLDTKTIANGSHTFTSIAKGSTGNASANIILNVSNTSNPAATPTPKPGPAGPVLISATALCTGNVSRATFKWNALTGAKTYKVVWSGYTPPGPDTAATTYTTPLDLPLSVGNHTWKVRGETGPSNYPTQYSTTATFTALNCASSPTPTPIKPPTASQYTITGNVFVDANGNGIKDTGEVGKSGVNVVVCNPSGGCGATRTTDASGNYDGGPHDKNITYTVTMTAPTGYAKSTTNPVSVSLTSNKTVNFGLKPASASQYTITGNVFVDTNGNGIKDSGEVGKSGVTITITNPNGGTAAPRTTDANGNYDGGVHDKNITYSVQASVPSGYTKSTTNPVSVSLTANKTVNFGLKPLNVPTPTPIRIDTPVPQPTNTPSPTPAANSTILSLNVGIDGIGTTGDNSGAGSSGSNINPLHPTRNVTVEIRNSANQVVQAPATGSIVYNRTSGKFAGTVNLGTSFTTGSYLVSIVSDAHLKRQLVGIQNIVSAATTTLPSTNLVAGDVNKDNLLNILDYNILLSCSIYSTDNNALCKSGTNLSTLSDLDDNGTVDQFDYNLFVREYAVQNGD